LSPRRRRWRALPAAAATVWLAAGLAGPAASGQTASGQTASGETAPEQAAQTPAPAPTVTAVEIRSEVPLGRRTNLDALVEVKPGAPLDDVAVRHTLRNVVASGIGADVSIYTRDEPGGVVAVLVLRPVEQVVKVEITGQLGLHAADLKAALPQHAAEPLAEESVVQGVYNLVDLYHRSGYFKATARVRITQGAARRVVVTYEVASGPRALVSAVDFDGATAPFTSAELVARLRARPSRPFLQRDAEEDAERLQDWLIKKGYGLAQVDRPRQDYDAEAERVRLTFPLTVGPRIDVKAQGADLGKLRKKGLLPFLGSAGYDEALVQQALARIRAYYQSQGRYHVQVDSAERRVDGVLELTLTVVPGGVYTLESIAFEGNQGLSSTKLATLMSTAPRNILRPGSGRLVQDTLNDDLANIRSFYALQGYAEAKVGAAEVTEHGGTLRLRVPIVEGPQQRLVKLDLVGAEKLDAKKLRAALPLKEGGPFHPVLLEQTLSTIRNAYGEAGYTQAQVSADSDWNAPHTLVDLTIRVLEGPRREVDQVIVRGNQVTEDDVILRTLGIKRGDALGQSRPYQLESSLYRLGIFSRVDVAVTGPGLDTSARDLVVQVEEGKFKSLGYGGGYDSEEKFRGLLSFSDNDVLGEADSMRLDLRASSLDQRFSLFFNQPFLGGLALPLNSTLFDFYTHEVSFRVRRWGGRSEVVKIVNRSRFSLALDYRVVRLRVDPGVALNSIERQDRPVEISSIIPAVLIDHRDDPLVPSRGWSSLAQLQYSFPGIGSPANFLKLFLQQTKYVNLGEPGVLAASLRFGAIEAFTRLGTGDPDVPPELPSSNVFIDERFFAGGSTTNRAYLLDDLGIRTRTLIQPGPGSHFMPVGGNGLLLANFDYRFPIAGALGGTVFFDSGNVWADWRDIRLAGTDGVKSGTGFGFRYLSPIGPLRAEVGWKLNRYTNPPEGPLVFFVSFGNPF
jgi:outer membrane protein insertion porin family